MTALSPAEAARLAAIEAAPDAPESHAATIERMARAIWNSHPGAVPWDQLSPSTPTRSIYRRLAAAAYRAEHEGGVAS